MRDISKRIVQILIAVIMVVLIPYIIVFNNGISKSSNDWSNLGSYFGGIVTPFVTVATLFWLIYSYTHQLKQLEVTNQMQQDKLLRESKVEKLNFYLEEARSRVQLFRDEYHYRTVNAIEYYDLILVELEAKGWTVEEYNQIDYDLKVKCYKGEEHNVLFYYEKKIWRIIYEFIGRVGKDKAVEFFKNGGFAEGEIHMSSYATQLKYLYGLLLKASYLLDELDIDNFIIRNMLSEQVEAMKVLKDLKIIDNQTFYSIMTLVDKPDVVIKRSDTIHLFNGLNYEFEEKYKSKLNLDKTYIFRHINHEILNDEYIVFFNGKYYIRTFNAAGIKKWEEITKESFIKLETTQINFS